MKQWSKCSTALALAVVGLIAVGCDSNDNSTPTASSSTTSGSGGTTGGATGPVQVTTYHNDLMRDGQNQNETILTPTNVNSSTFGKIGALPADGLVYAQPLFMQSVLASDGDTHDLVFVATEHDSVYAYDANSLSKTPVWQRHFLTDTCIAVSATQVGTCTTPTPIQVNAPNVSPEVGITATPVIDTASGTMYVTAMSLENGLYYWKLHALSIASGAEQPGSPIVIDSQYPGDGDGESAVDGLIYFSPINQLSRSGLVLYNGLVYIAFSSFNDNEPCHGWLFAYNAATLDPVSAYMSTPNSGDGNIWMSGGAPAVDTNGNIYLATGNGDATFAAKGVVDLADSVLKLTFGADGFDLEDYFTPYNRQTLAENDVDLGSGGVLLLPDQVGAYPHMLVAGGKEGTIFLIDRDNMGKLNTAAGATSDPQIIQELVNIVPGGKSYGNGIYGTMSYYNGNVYLVSAGDYLRSIPLTNGALDWANAQKSSVANTLRGATTSISANNNTDGIVWYLDASAYTYGFVTGEMPPTLTNGPAILYAFNASNVASPIYASNKVSTDAAGDAVKFAVPTVAHGKVFVGTQTELSVYGLRSDVAAANFRKGDRAIASVKPAVEYSLSGFNPVKPNACQLHDSSLASGAEPWAM
jgi:hypothetical protein